MALTRMNNPLRSEGLWRPFAMVLAVSLFTAACGDDDDDGDDVSGQPDAGGDDGEPDAGEPDAGEPDAGATIEPLAVVSGIDAAESCQFDAAGDRWLISSIGAGLGTPGDGSIRVIGAGDYALQTEPLVADLDDPAGLRLNDGLLYAADGTELLVIDIEDGAVDTRIDLAGDPESGLDAQFLNDVNVDPATGDVYVSDFLGNKIFVARGGDEPEVFAEGAELEAPNGILFDAASQELVIAGLGPDLDPKTFMTSAPGMVYRLALDRPTPVALSDRIGLLDGIEQIGDDLLVSNVAAAELLRIGPDGTAETVLAAMPTLTSTADICIDSAGGIVGIPDLAGNRVGFYRLTDLGF